jgi:hypothetical protein
MCAVPRTLWESFAGGGGIRVKGAKFLLSRLRAPP